MLMDVLTFAQAHGLGVRGLIRSPVLGPKGNVEFLAWLGKEDQGMDGLSLPIQQVLD